MMFSNVVEGLCPVLTTFGYITGHFRNQAGLEKSHVNDAVIIANHNAIPETQYIKSTYVQSRKRNLHEATARKGRKEPNRTQKRNNKNVFSLKGFNRWDTVLCMGRVGFISGFTGKSGCRIVDINGKYIKTPGKSYTQVNVKRVKFIHRNQGVIRQVC